MYVHRILVQTHSRILQGFPITNSFVTAMCDHSAFVRVMPRGRGHFTCHFYIKWRKQIKSIGHTIGWLQSRAQQILLHNSAFFYFPLISQANLSSSCPLDRNSQKISSSAIEINSVLAFIGK